MTQAIQIRLTDSEKPQIFIELPKAIKVFGLELEDAEVFIERLSDAVERGRFHEKLAKEAEERREERERNQARHEAAARKAG